MMKVNNKLKLEWRVDTVSLIKQLLEDSNISASNGVFVKPVNIFLTILSQVANRAIELDDPTLNVLMLRLSLYDVEPAKISEEIDNQYKRIGKIINSKRKEKI